MRPDEVRTLYQYHFALNRRVWDECILWLSEEQYKQPIDYSVGSIRNQAVHVMNTDERWFCGLMGREVPGWYDARHQFSTREALRVKWDEVEAMQRGYLDTLTEEILDGEFHGMKIWQVLFHVVNHGTDHRSQMLAMMAPMGAPTFAHDFSYMFMKR